MSQHMRGTPMIGKPHPIQKFEFITWLGLIAPPQHFMEVLPRWDTSSSRIFISDNFQHLRCHLLLLPSNVQQIRGTPIIGSSQPEKLIHEWFYKWMEELTPKAFQDILPIGRYLIFMFNYWARSLAMSQQPHFQDVADVKYTLGMLQLMGPPGIRTPCRQLLCFKLTRRACLPRSISWSSTYRGPGSSNP